MAEAASPKLSAGATQFEAAQWKMQTLSNLLHGTSQSTLCSLAQRMALLDLNTSASSGRHSARPSRHRLEIICRLAGSCRWLSNKPSALWEAIDSAHAKHRQQVAMIAGFGMESEWPYGGGESEASPASSPTRIPRLPTGSEIQTRPAGSLAPHGHANNLPARLFRGELHFYKATDLITKLRDGN